MDNIKKLGEQIILEMIQEIERKDMPQVKGKDVDDVLKIFDESGIKYEQGDAKCGGRLGNTSIVCIKRGKDT